MEKPYKRILISATIMYTIGFAIAMIMMFKGCDSRSLFKKKKNPDKIHVWAIKQSYGLVCKARVFFEERYVYDEKTFIRVSGEDVINNIKN